MPHTQNINKMGGLQKKMKVTGTLFLIGTLAISGVPLLSGFFSKDEILAATWMNGNYFLFVLAVIAAFLTHFTCFVYTSLSLLGKRRRRKMCMSRPAL